VVSAVENSFVVSFDSLGPIFPNEFRETTNALNAQDYTVEQVRAWAPDNLDPERWRSRIERINPYVCVYDGRIVGYADLQASGYIDHFFAHHQWQRKGIGKRLLLTIESEAKTRKLAELASNVSITARPFFESHGFRVVTPQEVALGTVVLKNFRMARQLIVRE
jgi:putative acetyltransferase